MLLAANHPNSFFDAVLLGALFKNPVHFLARGDAFKNPLAKKLLSSLRAIPIYRLSEGKEYLALNDTAFDQCLRVLQRKGIVLIFSEGLCVNQWQLRPLKKGTGRIAINAWADNTVSSNFQVLPVSLNYNSFVSFGKNVIIEFGQPITKSDITAEAPEAGKITLFNKVLQSRLEEGILIDDNTAVIQFLLSNYKLIAGIKQPVKYLIQLKKKFTSDLLKKELFQLSTPKTIALDSGSLVTNFLLFILLFIPAVSSLLLHLPFYAPLKLVIKNKTKGTVFYDSTLFAALIIAYPIYVLLIALLSGFFIKPVWLLLVVAIPLLGWLFLLWRDSTIALINYFKMDKQQWKSFNTLLS